MVECRLTATREQDSLPILTQTKVKAKHGNLAVWMFLDPGSGKSLISEQFYLSSVKGDNDKIYSGKKYKICGVDPTGEGINCDQHAVLTFIFPNNKTIQQEMLIVKDLPEPVGDNNNILPFEIAL